MNIYLEYDYDHEVSLLKEIIEQIEKIKQINLNQNLVIFVGAGVSKNSGVCSWWELVKEIADKINENKCSSCEIKDLICGECGEQIELCSMDGYNCKLKYDFSSEDFLRIPQHFYESFGNSEEEKKPYYEFLKDKFCGQKYETNIIDEIIVKLQPEHIITTNYDHLLEDVNDPRVSKYAVIMKDEDILSKKGRNYIIKMHGDIDDIENIVLREDDYLNYSQNHIIIETFIKSLLIDKTFLFVGYSLNDNNLKLIMSYIDFFVKEKRVENRQPHYLVIDKIKDSVHDIAYWENKGVELVDLSQISEHMVEESKCAEISNMVGKKLYSFLYFLNNNLITYTEDKSELLDIALKKMEENVECFEFISYKTIIEAFQLKSVYGIKAPVMTFTDIVEYNNFKNFAHDDNLRILLKKAGIYGIQLETGKNRESISFEESAQTDEGLFELSLRNKYHKIMSVLEKQPISSMKVYYCSLIQYTEGLMDNMNNLKQQFENVDYLNLSNQKCYELAIYQFNRTCARLLLYMNNNKEDYDRLNLLLDNAAARYSKSYHTIKAITENGSDIQEMNNYLLNHEEYYMKKANVSKLGGTIYGDLFKIRQIAYDYYMFYKKNHLMLDWFNNVEKMVLPYIKAMLCTYYPDEFQGEKQGGLPRTNVKPYPIELLDLDMIVKHVKQKDLRTIVEYYKVNEIELSEEIDISELFEDFCLSMKEYWNVRMIEQLETFSFLLTLCKIDAMQNERIVRAFVNLLKISKGENIRTITNNIYALSTYVKKHFDKNTGAFNDLLKLLINAEILLEPTAHKNAYPELISILSELADEGIYMKCCKEFEGIKGNNRQKTLWVYIYRNILLKYDENKWKNYIINNLYDNWDEEIFQFLYERILPFDEKMMQLYEKKLKEYGRNEINGVFSYPDYKTEVIGQLIILLLLGVINDNDIEFMRKYSDMSPYLSFVFNPEHFDYKIIKISDFMWCNFINNEKYRNKILEHKNDFWNNIEEKRINWGFGSQFENRVAYKYLFE